jgi:hypothetical protein
MRDKNPRKEFYGGMAGPLCSSRVSSAECGVVKHDIPSQGNLTGKKAPTTMWLKIYSGL